MGTALWPWRAADRGTSATAQLFVAVTDHAPVARGRTWTAADYVTRDAKLVALGIMPFHQSHPRQK
jgi:hypothetical protein